MRAFHSSCKLAYTQWRAAVLSGGQPGIDEQRGHWAGRPTGVRETSVQ